MATQYETVKVTISGANPQTKSVIVPVNPTTGAGSATFTYTGANGGSDILSGAATIAGSPLTSNSAQVNWQSSNGNIQVGSTVTCYAWGDSPTSGGVASYLWGSTGGAIPRNITSSGVISQVNNSLAFDAYISGANVNTGNPTWSTFNAAGTAVGSVSFPPYAANFNCIILANLLVPAAGSYTLTLTYKDGSMWGIGPSTTGAIPTWAGKGTYVNNAGQTATANSNYPLLNAPAVSGDDNMVGSTSTVVTFSQAGVYPLEGNWDFWRKHGRVFHITANASEIAPVTLIAAPPSSTPTGHLTITPAGGSTNLQVVNQAITLTVNVSGIVYPTKSYVPVYEGQTGYLLLYNDPTNSVFNFQTYNGQTVSKTSAATSVFALSSTDNSAYQGLFAVTYDGTNFRLNYNGGTANSTSASRVLSTNLTVAADDIAWYNSTKNTFDVFTISGSTGGTSFNFEVDYMNKPAVSSISPTTITANGGSNTLAVSLNKAFSPQQQGAKNTGNTVNCTCSISGATSTGTPVPVLDSNGWLTGWNIPFTAPTATSNQTLSVTLTVSGTLTYLSGNGFVTNSVTYISGVIGSITANGTAFVAPSAQGFSTLPAGPAITSATTAMTASATVFTAGSNDSMTCAFFSQATGSSIKTIIGNGTLQSSSAATVGGVSGFLHVFNISFAPSTYIGAGGSNLGFTATDNVSGLNCSYTSTSTYTYTVTGGGGGTNPPVGCPAVEMFVLPNVQVSGVTVGTELDAIVGLIERPDIDAKKLPVLWMNFSDEVSYHLATENGAEVIISGSTPVPTQEAKVALNGGASPDTLPLLASQMRLGLHVLTDINGVMEWSILTKVDNVGARRVARLYIGGENFAAGVTAEKRIYTHNVSVVK